MVKLEDNNISEIFSLFSLQNPKNFRMQTLNSGKIFERDILSSDTVSNSTT